MGDLNLFVDLIILFWRKSGLVAWDSDKDKNRIESENVFGVKLLLSNILSLLNNLISSKKIKAYAK